MCIAYNVKMHLYARYCEKFSCLNLSLVVVVVLLHGCFWLSRVLFPVHDHSIFFTHFSY
jgi:hypothetical protein